MEEHKIIVTDRPVGRTYLAEARAYQMGFAFLKRDGRYNYEAIHPLSCCKDYLNDLVFTLQTGKIVEAFGIKTKKNDSKYLNKNSVYLGFKILPYFNRFGSYVPQFMEQYNTSGIIEDKERLRVNIRHVETIINYMEGRLNVEGRTVIKVAEDDYYVAMLPKYWVQHQYLISIYSLLLRIGQYYNGTIEPQAFLDQPDHKHDTELWKSIQNKVNHLISKGLWKIDYKAMTGDLGGGCSIHSAGISSIHHTFKKYIDPFEEPKKEKPIQEIRWEQEPLEFEAAEVEAEKIHQTFGSSGVELTKNTMNGGTINPGLSVQKGNSS